MLRYVKSCSMKVLNKNCLNASYCLKGASRMNLSAKSCCSTDASTKSLSVSCSTSVTYLSRSGSKRNLTDDFRHRNGRRHRDVVPRLALHSVWHRASSMRKISWSS